MTKTKAPMPAAAIFLLISTALGFILNLITIITHAVELIGRDVPVSVSEILWDSLISNGISLMMMLFDILLCVVLFMRKRNGVLALATGLFTFRFVYVACNALDGVIKSNGSFIGNMIRGKLTFEKAILICGNNLSNSGAFLRLIGAALLLVFALSVCNKIFKNEALKKLQAITKKAFWLPGLLFALAIIFTGLGLIVTNGYHLAKGNIDASDMLKTLLSRVIYDIPSVLSVLFAFTFALWIKKHYGNGGSSPSNAPDQNYQNYQNYQAPYQQPSQQAPIQPQNQHNSSDFYYS